ncbi:hypothetical protein CERSUDRAFT_69481 [Gelatoporia subvermispora B]|uniref:Cyclopropane-fatty-acyl-phospholipid synthase n=1 Tax=Ceriporiopsis subvermispora (strain B) TaxID=914234 RepID=M2QXG5_CERS8|nr:hypothetical protein CERSUDRAFT_69481 [Gelatoporia subvermispora B]
MHSKTWNASLVDRLSTSRVWKTIQLSTRDRVLAILRNGIQRGELVMQDHSGVHVFGTPSPGLPRATISVFNDNLWVRVALTHDLGLSEAYMNGEFDTPDLKGLLNLWLENRDTLEDLPTILTSVLSYASGLFIKLFGQTLSMSETNASLVYDTSNEFFRCFLSEEMMYSCALWGKEENGVRGDLTVGSTPGDLEAAQQRKIRHILSKARVKPGHRVLEIGSGWGAMALEAARMGCIVDTITLSREQQTLVQTQAIQSGVEDRIRVHLLDYRQLPESFKDAFDAVISSEMIEHVGLGYHAKFFQVIDWALNPHRGMAVITSTTRPENRYSEIQSDDFARHYHWPNAFLPCATSLASTAQTVLKGRLVLESIENHGIHYPRTLREWGRRFERNFDDAVVDQLKSKFEDLDKTENLAAFKRKWKYLFVYAEVGFARAYTSVGCWTFARPENISEPCD